MENQIEKAIDLMGGTNQVVRKLGLNGHGTVYQWRVQGRVPAKYCPLIEEETGIPCEYLNSEVPWGVLRSTSSIIAAGSTGAIANTQAGCEQQVEVAHV